MRTRRNFRPTSSQERFSVSKRIIIGIGSILAVTPVMPAHAETVTVGFGFGTIASTAAACQLSVPTGANGFAVLDAAVAKGCITSYKTTGRWNGYEGYAVVRCINEVCEQIRNVWGPCDTSVHFDVLWYHAAYNADLTQDWGPGLEDFRASNGKSLAVYYGRSIFGVPGGSWIAAPINATTGPKACVDGTAAN
jgi:hypothetical protein